MTHSGHVTRSAMVMTKDSGHDVGKRCPWQDLVVGDAVLSPDAKDSSGLCLLERFQTFDLPTIQSSSLTSVQKGGEDHDPEDHDFIFYGEALISGESI